MKTSIGIITALLLNTMFLVAEPVALLTKGIDPFIFLGAETALLLGYFLNKWLENIHRAFQIDLGHIDVFANKAE
ncbi:hypothetical protein ACEZ3G_05380 [Maribacter algicola]|uniref:Uncharacterized protein n=1 Tax=Meishania litoralis TaxID=3434685 RepID=A0ACC7LHB7_9FLAO